MKMKASHKVITLLINRGKCKNRTLRSSLSFYQIDLNTVLQFKSKGEKKNIDQAKLKNFMSHLLIEEAIT